MAPENTLVAVRTAAASDGVAAVEVDVRPTADGSLVCLHDVHLPPTDRSRGVTDGWGTVCDLPRGAVRAATVLGSGERVPGLRAALEVVPDEVAVVVELKHPRATVPRAADRDPATVRSPGVRWADVVGEVADVIEALDHDRAVLLSSFFDGALAAARDVAPSRPVAVLEGESLDRAQSAADRFDAAAIFVRRTLLDGAQENAPGDASDAAELGEVSDTAEQGVGATSPAAAGTEAFLAASHAADRAVFAWTVRTWWQAARLRAVGVDGIVADYPGLLDPPGTG